MIIEFSTAFALRCPECGHMNIDQINIFQLSGNQEREIICDCGFKMAVIRKKGTQNISLRYKCIICDKMHNTVISNNKFWSKNRFENFICPQTSLNLGYYGSYKLIKQELDKQQEEVNSMAIELGLDDFGDPELMLDMLDFLHDISAKGDLYCECGSHNINIDLFSNKIKLICSNCGASLVIPVDEKSDLDDLKIQDQVVLQLSGSNRNPKGPWINI